MKTPLSHFSGLTLVETMFAVAITVVLCAAFLNSSITLQRSFSAAESYSDATNNQQRIMDYISRDIRRASSVPSPGTSGTLQLTIPDCYASYDAQGNPSGAFVSGTVDSTGKVTYKANDLVVTYSVVGSRLVRQQKGGSMTGTSALYIATNVSDFQLSGTVGVSGSRLPTSVYNCTISFAPKFSSSTASSARNVLRETITMRNISNGN